MSLSSCEQVSHNPSWHGHCENLKRQHTWIIYFYPIYTYANIPQFQYIYHLAKHKIKTVLCESLKKFNYVVFYYAKRFSWLKFYPKLWTTSFHITMFLSYLSFLAFVCLLLRQDLKVIITMLSFFLCLTSPGFARMHQNVPPLLAF